MDATGRPAPLADTHPHATHLVAAPRAAPQLTARISADMKAAMKAKDSAR